MYIKTVGEFLRDVETDFQDAVIRVLEDNRGKHDGDAEKRSWEESLPALAQVLRRLPEAVRAQCEIVLEANYEQVDEKRADAVLVGTCGGRKTAVILENKRWSGVRNYRALGENSVWDPWHKRMIQHPSGQAEYYRKTLEYTNRYVQDEPVDVFSAAFLQNATLREKRAGAGVFDRRYRALMERSPVFTGDDGDGMAAYLSEKLTGGLPGTAEKIYASETRFSPAYRSILRDLFGSGDALTQLLDEKQAALFDEITAAVRDPAARRVFLIEGEAGTGKTVLAAALLARLHQGADRADLKVRYIEKNRPPRVALTRDHGVPPQMVASSLKPIRTVHDCLICDESHRMMEQVYLKEDDRAFLDEFLKYGRIAVFFYDEKQSVHVFDYVTKARIREAALQNGVAEGDLIERRLTYQHRCRAAARFQSFVRQLLDAPAPKPGKELLFRERDEYSAALVDDPRTLFRLIREKNSRRGDAPPSRVLAGKGAGWTFDTKNTSYDHRTIAPLRGSDEKAVHLEPCKLRRGDLPHRRGLRRSGRLHRHEPGDGPRIRRGDPRAGPRL